MTNQKDPGEIFRRVTRQILHYHEQGYLTDAGALDALRDLSDKSDSDLIKDDF